mmetsp:Transcript_3899/g.3838  ORF Transcript_3899/g.3838 Transcript_3899/m.3838 type:complete len:215 (-) Transcript_3899:16-660(-)
MMMFGPIIGEELVDFIADDEDVWEFFVEDVREGLDLFLGEDLAGGVHGRVEDEQAALLRESLPEQLIVNLPSLGLGVEEEGSCLDFEAGELDVVHEDGEEGLEDHHLVPRAGQGQGEGVQEADPAGPYQHLRPGVQLPPQPLRVEGADGFCHYGLPLHPRVLVLPFLDGLDQLLPQEVRGIRVWSPLAQRKALVLLHQLLELSPGSQVVRQPAA